MIADGKRLCETCGTRLLASILICPVCALRTGLDSTEDDLTFAEFSVGAQNRFEHYEIVIGEDQEPVELGRGAMGVTYKATDTNLHCPVALKVINSRYLDDESVRQRFLTEARAAAGLRHPNVASVFHLGSVEGDYFYAMEFVEGKSLDRVLRDRGPLEVDLALEIVNQVASALGAGYRKGLVHRDIKPANLMVVFEEPGEVTVKVIDYGLVRTAQGASGKPVAPRQSVGGTRRAVACEGGPEAERFIGTPQFASPEQCAGKDADIRSDLYSLGVTLWVMLSGKLPFEGRFSELIRKHQVEPPPFGQLEHLPELVLSLLQFLLEKDPRKRPQTPLELRARVREVQKALASGRHPWSAASLARPIRSEPWSGDSPYRGLQVFDVENEAIFFGRTKERDEILSTLQTRSNEENKPFILIFGASGCGKSSLLRAGVMPWLCRPGVIEGVDFWRSLLFRPSDYPGDLLEGLADALLSPGALPEIGADGTDSLKLAALLQQSPEGLGLLVEEALSRVAGDEKRRLDLLQRPVVRLAIGLDQLEEIFTLSERFSPDSRVSFFKAVQALVESGYGWVVATLRSDFFSECEEIDALVELKQGNGQYHLLAPKAAQLSQMIRYPAEAAGVVFEEHPEKGPLGERIRDDALKEPGGLPLLEYALDELFRIGSVDGVLSHADYEALGGVEGALRKRAEDAFARLEFSERAALGPVLNQIARLGSGDDETLTRRVASYETSTAQPGAKGLVDAFILARLLIADRDGAGNRTLAVAHEALFRVWPEISRWEKENRDFLRVRARIGEAMGRWVECNHQSDYLLAPGRPLAEAEDLLKNCGAGLDPEEKKYILASRATVARGVRRRRLITAGVIAVLAVVAGAAMWEWRTAVQSENRAVSARSSAEGILNYLLNQLSDKLKPIGHLDIVEDVQKQVETYYKNLGFSERDPKALSNRATILEQEGERLIAQGDLKGAAAKYQQSLEIRQKLAKQDPYNNDWQRALAGGYEGLGDVLQAQMNLDDAKAQYQSALDIRQRLVGQEPRNGDWRHNLAATYIKLGFTLELQGDLNRAKAAYQDALDITKELCNRDPVNSDWQRDLSRSYLKLGDALKAQGDLNGSKKQFQSSLEIKEMLAKREPGNTVWQRDLTVAYERLADVLQAQGDLDGARVEDQNDLDIVTRLATQDPGNRGWQVDLWISTYRLGDVLKAQGDLIGCEARYQRALEIIQKLAQSDPSNKVWQRSLSISYERLGLLSKDRGDLMGAKDRFESSQEIREKLVKLDPQSSGPKRDWMDTFSELGDISKAQGDLNGARTQYEKSVELAEDLVKQDPSNTRSQRELLQGYEGFGEVLLAQGEFNDAKKQYQRSLEIGRKLTNQDPSNTAWQCDLSECYKDLGVLLKQLGDIDGARQNLKASRDILTSLIRLHGENPTWKADLDQVNKELGE